MRQAIFIGYRRADTADVAGRLYDALSLAFGDGKIFKDVDSIPLGADFAAHIKGILPKCRVFLALIGPDWVAARGANGTQRFDDESDLVRIEIETALATPKLLVVPVLVNGARMPDEHEVPASLRPLLKRHAAILRRDPDFKGDVARLADALREHLRTGRLDLQPLGGAARVAANAAGLSGWLVLVWLAVAGAGVTAAVPQLRQPILDAATGLLKRPGQTVATTAPVQQQPSPLTTSTPVSTVFDTTTTTTTPPPAASPPQNLGNGVSVTLVSLSEQYGQRGGSFDGYGGRYIATFRFQNTTSDNVGVAVLSKGFAEAQMVLTDGVGGSCSMIANGEGWGTMDAEQVERHDYDSEVSGPVPAGGQSQQTIFFNKGRCATPITARSGLTISGSFIVVENGARRAAPVFFGDLTMPSDAK